MLKVYHAEPGANSLKVLLALKEKGVQFESNYIALDKFDQHSDWFKEINPCGQVPVIVHDGQIINESTVINEYIDAVFNGPTLRPADEYGRAAMRLWTKFVDEYFCPALSYIVWNWMIKDIVRDMTEEEFEDRLLKIPLQEQRDKWRITAREGYSEDRLQEWYRQVVTSVQRMEMALADHGGPWLLGDQFTLADISCFSMALPMPEAYPEIMSDALTPYLMRWLARMMARPGVQAALAMPNQFGKKMQPTTVS